MRSKNFISVFLLRGFLLCFPFWSIAQSNEKKIPTQFIVEENITKNLGFEYLDSNINETENFNVWYRRERIFQDLGNIGTAGRSAVFNLQNFNGFKSVFNPFENYFMQSKDVKYFNTTIPVTELFFAQGSKELLFLKATHAQNILPRWSVALDYQRITSEGFFLRQKTSMYNLQFNTRYFSKNKRYELLAHTIWNFGYAQENGGISNDSAFEALTGANKSVNVWLNNSENQYHQRNLFLKQYYKFGSPISLIQKEDTLYDYLTKAQVFHSIRTEENNYVFINNGDTFNGLFNNPYLSNIPQYTYDSTYNGIMENKFGVQLFSTSDSILKRFVNFGTTHQAIAVSQSLYTKYYQNILLHSQLEWTRNKIKSLSFFFNGTYCINGFNQDDYSVTAKILLRLKPINIAIEVNEQRFRPEYSYYRFSSHYFSWDNNLNATQVSNKRLLIHTNTFRNNFNLALNHYTVSDYTYLNAAMLPEQQATNANVLQIELSKTFQLGKLYLHNQLYYQHSKSTSIPLPEFGAFTRLYFQSKFYGSIIQLGIDAFYNTAYYGLGWNPISRLFYIQQQTKIGNYPLLNPYFSMQVKRVTVFAQYDHVNQNLINKGFYNTPHYPIALQSFKFGIKWRMYY